jgi:hypothetical protein
MKVYLSQYLKAPRDTRARAAVGSLAQRTDHTFIENLDAALLLLADLGLGGENGESYPLPMERSLASPHRGWCHILTTSGPTLSSEGP